VLGEVAQRLPLVFALHPRTRANIERFGLGPMVDAGRMILLPPQGYLEMLGLMAGATLVLTDSGGLQEETTALGVPCLTLRENTERPITVEQGTNTMVGGDADAIRAASARSSPAAASAAACPSAGTAMPPSASRPTSGNGWRAEVTDRRETPRR
jgi:UDP-N-acetylglucosamine 2-epimerase (non-hydrolysing)